MRYQITARVPEATHAQLKALAAALQTSQADIVTRAIAAYERTLSPRLRRIVGLLKTVGADEQ